MSNGVLLGGIAGGAAKNASRIEIQTETLKSITSRITNITHYNIVHARQLGYYEPSPPTNGASAPEPVVSSLDDALRELQRAVDALDGSMNLFN